MILSNNAYPLAEAQFITDPFAFGGLKVVPRGNLTFRQAEDLWYFVETRNPGIDPATTQPKMSLKVTITGKTDEGKPVKIAGPAEVVQAIELKGVTGHWGVGQAIPLAGGIIPAGAPLPVGKFQQALSLLIGRKRGNEV